MIRVLFVFMMVALKGWSAAPLFHAVIGEKWIEAFEDYDEEERKAFMLGTLFPDIRYIAGCSRESTHEYGLTVEQILSVSDPFLKGMKVHSLVDEIRDKYVKTNLIFDSMEGCSGDLNALLKILEDETLFRERKQGVLETICHYFQSYHPEELERVSLEYVQRWHKMQILVFSQPPSEVFSLCRALGKSYGKMTLKTMQFFCDYIPVYRDQEWLISYVHDVLREFDRIFSESKDKHI